MGRVEDFRFPKIDMEETGKYIRQICRDKDVSVKDIQECLYIASNQAVYDWFNGKSLRSVDNLKALSCLLDTLMDDMVILKEESQEDCSEESQCEVSTESDASMIDEQES